MERLRKHVELFILILISIPGISNDTKALKDRCRDFNLGWKFVRDTVIGAENPNFDDKDWKSVDLPHDFSMMNLPREDGSSRIGPFSKSAPGNGNSTGQIPGGTGWYRKSFALEKSDEGKTVILSFDGVYMETEVWVNGKKAGIHKNGYTPFWFDITSLLNASGTSNVISVKVINNGRNSRWYSGSGIYRNVQLIVTNPVHLNFWGMRLKTLDVNQKRALTELSVDLANDLSKDITAQIQVNIKDKNGNYAASSNETCHLNARSSSGLVKSIEIKDPQLWSVEAPNLYTAEVIISIKNKEVDRFEQPFGVRMLSFSADHGFLLNSKVVKLKGGCLHHDNGLLGSAAFNRAEERKVELMKAAGYNAIRCAHNPPSTAFLDACDRIGMLVIDEFIDMWENYKNPQDYSRFFREWWNKDLTNMIMRDRNHPCIIMWSIGNEIYEVEDSTRLRIGKQLSDRVRELDDTRAVTQALTDFFYPEGWDFTAPAFAMLNVGGYNYGNKYYKDDHDKYPNRVMYSSESYPINAFEYWEPVEKYPWIIGDFVWTAMDYFGEVSLGSTSYTSGKGTIMQSIPAGFKLPKKMNIFDMQVKSKPSLWPAYLSWCGDIDITGECKPQKLYRDILWDNSKIEINVHAPVPEAMAEMISMWGWPDEKPSWNWKGNEGKTLKVRIFSKASHIRLVLNGKTIGEKDLSPEDKFIAVFDVPYQPGLLKAFASDKQNVTASRELKTTGNPVAIRLKADRTQIHSNRGDLSYVSVEIVDKEGMVVPDADVFIKLTISGNGEIAASGNGSLNDMESVNKPVIKTYNGKAQVIVRPFNQKGKITLNAESEGLPVQRTEILVD